MTFLLVVPLLVMLTADPAFQAPFDSLSLAQDHSTRPAQRCLLGRMACHERGRRPSRMAPEEGLVPKSTVFANDLEAVSAESQSNQACSLKTFPNSATAGY